MNLTCLDDFEEAVTDFEQLKQKPGIFVIKAGFSKGRNRILYINEAANVREEAIKMRGHCIYENRPKGDLACSAYYGLDYSRASIAERTECLIRFYNPVVNERLSGC